MELGPDGRLDRYSRLCAGQFNRQSTRSQRLELGPVGRLIMTSPQSPDYYDDQQIYANIESFVAARNSCCNLV